MKKCPSCGNDVDVSRMSCGVCGWQFSGAAICSTRPAQTMVRAAARPNCLCSQNCQLAVIVRDASGSMCGAKAREASNASVALANVLADPSNRDGFYCAVVDFADTSAIVHPATKASELVKTMTDLKPGSLGGATNITDGLTRADEVLRGFSSAEGRASLRPVVLLLSDGQHTHSCDPDSVATIIRAKADLVTIAFGDDADEAGLRSWASPDMFVRCSSGADLRKFFAAVGATMQATRARGVAATQALANLDVA